MPTPQPDSRPTLRQQLIAALVPWFLTGERRVNVLDLDDLLREPEVAPLATQLGYLPAPDDVVDDIRRVHLRADLERAVRHARAAETFRLGHDPGVPPRTDRAFSLALADVVAAAREAARRLAAAERQAHDVGDAPAEVEFARLAEDARVLAGACDLLYESRRLRE